MKKLIVLVAALIISIPLSAGAIPSLGVAPTSGGVYYGPYDTYLDYFADSFIPKLSGDDAGFIMPDSGGSLTVWYGADNGVVDYDADIYLATNSAAGSGFTFDGSLLNAIIGGNQADGYKPTPYFGLNLGSITDDWADDGDGIVENNELTKWAILNDSDWPGLWFIYTGVIEYSGFKADQEDWMFAIADVNLNGNFDGGTDDFSPKTTSSSIVKVPEPMTLILLGFGLLGLAGIRRK